MRARGSFLPWSEVLLTYIEVGCYGIKFESLAKHSPHEVYPSDSHDRFGEGGDTLPPNLVCQDSFVMVPGPDGPYTFY